MATQEHQKTEQTKNVATKSSGKKTTTPAPTSSGKAKPVITDDEVSRMIDLGLGRGVDATQASPWSMKSSFQVRQVTLDNIIGTEEGGALQAYEREISSVITQQSTLKSSISVPKAPITMSLEGEYSRSSSSTRKAVGKQVINRTISFRADFDDIPQGTVHDDSDGKEMNNTDTGSATTHLYTGLRRTSVAVAQTQFTFEQRLAEWILERVLQRWEKACSQARESGNPEPKRPTIIGVNPISDIVEYLREASTDDKKDVFRDCTSFIRHFRITHYVSAIQLGAAEYRVLSENEYYKKVSSSGSFGLEAVAKFVGSESYSKRSKVKASDTRQIGKIIKDKVERGSYDEAVVGIKIQPIHTLVKLRYLHLALRRALLDYVDQQGDTTSGPYLIACGDKPNIFWQVNKDEQRHLYSVGATTDRRAASFFYIIPNDNGAHPYEFRIGWAGDNVERHLKRNPSVLRPDTPGHLEPLFRYLDARVGFYGSNPGPLYLKSELHNQHSRLSLHNRVIGDNKAPTDTKVWSYGNEEFFINCARRRFKKDGFIAVKRISVRGRNRQMEEDFVTVCLPTEKYHDERNVWMLFRLFPAQFYVPSVTDTEAKSPQEAQEDELDDEFEGVFGKISKLPLINLVLPQRERSSSHTETQGAEGGGEGLTMTASGSGSGGGGAHGSSSSRKLDIGGESHDVSGSHMASKGVNFKHEAIPMTELPPTTTTTQI